DHECGSCGETVGHDTWPTVPAGTLLAATIDSAGTPVRAISSAVVRQKGRSMGDGTGRVAGAAKRKRHPLAKVKGGWTPEEDELLRRLVQELGVGHWSPIARQLNLATGKDDSCGRIGKQCRERWNHHLRPGICKAAWSPEEELALVKAHRVLGNRWSDIARSIEGRSENSVKNVWFATLRRRDIPEPSPGPLKLYMLELQGGSCPAAAAGAAHTPS
ncbi:hypothetical protein QJQ45_026555, partial [Haematococcus lacustris]